MSRKTEHNHALTVRLALEVDGYGPDAIIARKTLKGCPECIDRLLELCAQQRASLTLIEGALGVAQRAFFEAQIGEFPFDFTGNPFIWYRPLVLLRANLSDQKVEIEPHQGIRVFCRGLQEEMRGYTEIWQPMPEPIEVYVRKGLDVIIPLGEARTIGVFDKICELYEEGKFKVEVVSNWHLGRRLG